MHLIALHKDFWYQKDPLNNHHYLCCHGCDCISESWLLLSVLISLFSNKDLTNVIVCVSFTHIHTICLSVDVDIHMGWGLWFQPFNFKIAILFYFSAHLNILHCFFLNFFQHFLFYFILTCFYIAHLKLLF